MAYGEGQPLWTLGGFDGIGDVIPASSSAEGSSDEVRPLRRSENFSSTPAISLLGFFVSFERTFTGSSFESTSCSFRVEASMRR